MAPVPRCGCLCLSLRFACASSLSRAGGARFLTVAVSGNATICREIPILRRDLDGFGMFWKFVGGSGLKHFDFDF